ncbi:MAG: hypothetical protein AB1540_06195, partial [Bdellovibrionota bacterium]
MSPLSSSSLLASFLNACSFWLRDHFWGRLRLRPAITSSDRLPKSKEEISFYLMLIERGLSDAQRSAADLVVDVGCRNWAYFDALKKGFSQAHFLGVELDGGRRYWNLYRRRDYAEGYASSCEAQSRVAQCQFGDF